MIRSDKTKKIRKKKAFFLRSRPEQDITAPCFQPKLCTIMVFPYLHYRRIS